MSYVLRWARDGGIVGARNGIVRRVATADSPLANCASRGHAPNKNFTVFQFARSNYL